jgi:ribosomal protein S1
MLTSELTEWRIRLREVARAPAWKAIETARAEQRSVPARILARVPKGLAVEVYGLNALLPIGQVQGVSRSSPARRVDALLRERLGQDVRVRILRLDADAGHIYVSEQVPTGRQLRLPLSD